MVKSSAIENIFKSWGTFLIYQVIKLDNPAQFYSKRAKLAVLIPPEFEKDSNGTTFHRHFYVKNIGH